MRRLAWFVAAILATVSVVVILWAFRATVVLFFMSLAIAAAVRPMVESQIKPGISRRVALLLIYGVALGGLVGLGLLASRPLSEEIQRLGNQLSTSYGALQAASPEGTPLQQFLGRWLPPPDGVYAALAGAQGVALIEGALGMTSSFFALASQFLAVLVLSIYWSMDQTAFERVGLSLLPVEQRARARDSWRAVEKAVGAHVRRDILTSVLAGLLLALGYRVMGLDFPILLAAGGAVARFVPWLGAGLALVPLLLLETGHPGLVVAAAVYTLGVFALLTFVVEPRLFDTRRYSSLGVVLLMFALVELWGLVGILVAAPLATALQVLAAQLVRQANVPATTQIAEELDDVEKRLNVMRAALIALPEPVSPQTLSLVGRLEQLVERSSDAITDDLPERPSALASAKAG